MVKEVGISMWHSISVAVNIVSMLVLVLCYFRSRRAHSMLDKFHSGEDRPYWRESWDLHEKVEKVLFTLREYKQGDEQTTEAMLQAVVALTPPGRRPSNRAVQSARAKLVFAAKQHLGTPKVDRKLAELREAAAPKAR
jgi:uncharacterized membrane protein